MIISHEHRFIFFAVPRTATHAVRQALRPHLGEGDWEQQMLFGEQAIPIPAIAAIRHGHISFVELREHVDRAIRESYFKFAFVRNPYDRFVSTCCFLNRRNQAFRGRETAFMKRAIRDRAFRARVLVRPQYRLLADEHDRVMMDYVGRYERLQDGYDEICAHLGLPSSALASRNASVHEDRARYYDAELERAVARFYARDFELFGYEAGDVARAAGDDGEIGVRCV